ncbi:nose resistant to fluoxetine protein 6-like [Ptychodera flava]|uniref:nose resistant to fluoxetine protein 6-like n=1 Tax=Ptychodera flava TaxID=63121 RepID=UPI00396A6341
MACLKYLAFCGVIFYSCETVFSQFNRVHMRLGGNLAIPGELHSKQVIGLRDRENLPRPVLGTDIRIPEGVNNKLSDMLAVVNVGQQCTNDTRKYVSDVAAGEKYAIRMFDAVAKPPSGIMDGTFQWVGSSEECRSVKGHEYDSKPGFNGKYCQAIIEIDGTGTYINQMYYGVCVPDTCKDAEVLELINKGMEMLPVKGLNASAVLCTENQTDLTTGAIVMLSISGVLVFFMTVGTVFQLFVRLKNHERDKDALPVTLQDDDITSTDEHEVLTLKWADRKRCLYQPGIFGQCVLAFSVLENGRKILDTRHTAGTLAAIHGIRVLSMWWVILGHSYTLMVFTDNVLVMQDVMKRFTFQAIENATFSVDTFFFLSGLLVTYLTLQQLREDRKVNWVMFYLHRFWRLTPMYMFAIFFWAYLMPYLGNGPYKAEANGIQEPCYQYWWTNLLYINNLVPWPAEIQCYGPAWYLANDMQFHVISPLLILLLYKRPRIGCAALFILISCCLATRAVLGVHYDLTSDMDVIWSTANDSLTYYVSSFYYYPKPWTRISTYLIGMFVGYRLVMTSCHYKINRILNIVCWITAWAIGLAVLYGVYGIEHASSLSRWVDILYMTVGRTAWGVAIGWLTFACLTGNGGPINSILAWKAWIPLSRMTYAAYLFHPMVITVYLINRDRLIHASDVEMIHLYVSWSVLSYCIAFVVSLMTEAPMIKLERVLLRKDA